MTALAEAVRELRGAAGAVLAVLFAGIGLGTVVAQETLLAASVDQYLAVGGDPATIPVDPATVGGTPLALGLSYGVSLLLFGLVALVSEYGAVVTLRVVAGEDLAVAARRRVASAVAVGFLVGVVVRTLVVVGLVALVVPGVFVAVSLLFAHPAVAIDDAGPTEALRRAWSLATGRRIEVLSVVSLLAVVYLTPRLAASFVAGTPGLVLSGVAGGLATLLSAGIMGRAYVAAVATHEETTDETADPEDDDPYDAPLGPDDLPEPE
jgi:hypothetical protein